MAIIERFRAASNKRRVWVVCDVLVALAMLVFGVWWWDLPRSVAVVLLGLVFLVCSIAQELYRRTWGTIGLAAGSLLLAAVVVGYLWAGALSWPLVYIGGPVLCLVAAVGVWRERSTAKEFYIAGGGCAEVHRSIGERLAADRTGNAISCGYRAGLWRAGRPGGELVGWRV
ncbi:MAG: hypothetical protein H8E73_02505 [Planctomycetes bacterium]|nr:hypothetical protein [Planctomycetota bacterium]